MTVVNMASVGFRHLAAQTFLVRHGGTMATNTCISDTHGKSFERTIYYIIYIIHIHMVCVCVCVGCMCECAKPDRTGKGESFRLYKADIFGSNAPRRVSVGVRVTDSMSESTMQWHQEQQHHHQQHRHHLKRQWKYIERHG